MNLPTYLRPFLFAILTLHALMLLAGAAFGEDKLPADAEKLVAAFDADAAKMRAETEKAIEKKAATLATALQKAQDAATKKGDLEGAMAIKAKIAALSGKEATAVAGTSSGNVPAGNKAPTRDDTGGKYVVLYNETDYGGMKVKVPVPTDITQVMTLGFPNDALRSIQVPPGVVVKLYDADMGGGAVTEVTESISDLTTLTHIGTTSLSAKRK